MSGVKRTIANAFASLDDSDEEDVVELPVLFWERVSQKVNTTCTRLVVRVTTHPMCSGKKCPFEKLVKTMRCFSSWVCFVFSRNYFKNTGTFEFEHLSYVKGANAFASFDDSDEEDVVEYLRLLRPLSTQTQTKRTHLRPLTTQTKEVLLWEKIAKICGCLFWQYQVADYRK